MRYTVIWSPFAQDQLADLWLAAADRDALTRAAHDIDRTLRDDPDAKGFPFGGDRMFVAGPLRVVFVVRPDDRTAEVIEVW
jgi:plasmid stabilization system protein ParE